MVAALPLHATKTKRVTESRRAKGRWVVIAETPVTYTQRLGVG
jgi:hypothetical protein